MMHGFSWVLHPPFLLAAYMVLLITMFLASGCQVNAGEPSPPAQATLPTDPEGTAATLTNTPPQATSETTDTPLALTPAETPTKTVAPHTRVPADTPAAGPQATMTPLHESPTALPDSPAELPEPILIFGPGGASREMAYEEAVVAVTTADLAGRLAVPADHITVTSSGPVETQLTAPCGPTIKQEEGPMAGGLAVGYEVNLVSGGGQYRYVALGGLAYYCPIPSSSRR